MGRDSSGILTVWGGRVGRRDRVGRQSREEGPKNLQRKWRRKWRTDPTTQRKPPPAREVQSKLLKPLHKVEIWTFRAPGKQLGASRAEDWG